MFISSMNYAIKSNMGAPNLMHLLANNPIYDSNNPFMTLIAQNNKSLIKNFDKFWHSKLLSANI